jgi:hypothetical protein
VRRRPARARAPARAPSTRAPRPRPSVGSSRCTRSAGCR